MQFELIYVGHIRSLYGTFGVFFFLIGKASMSLVIRNKLISGKIKRLKNRFNEEHNMSTDLLRSQCRRSSFEIDCMWNGRISI